MFSAARLLDMMTEHSRPILENVSDGLLFQVAQFFATASIPEEILEALRVGRLTQHCKNPTEVSAGLWQVTFKTMAQQLGPRKVWCHMAST